jgi:hypothetical protein
MKTPDGNARHMQVSFGVDAADRQQGRRSEAMLGRMATMRWRRDPTQ